MTFARVAMAVAKTLKDDDRDNLDPRALRLCADAVQAALAAIEEPTPEMLAAGLAKFVQIETGSGMTIRQLREIWRAMFAAMMKEGLPVGQSQDT